AVEELHREALLRRALATHLQQIGAQIDTAAAVPGAREQARERTGAAADVGHIERPAAALCRQRFQHQVGESLEAAQRGRRLALRAVVLKETLIGGRIKYTR